ncbi:MAG: class I SAM-dependent methyltransferase [Balneolaceae bacterium]|nr:MAG: class I SAM-dependent methyltransferase [Balneolaceae bacterium]
MFDRAIREVLLDAPKIIKNSSLNQQEKKELMAKGLNHFQAFSVIQKQHLLFRYGKLLSSLKKRMNRFGCERFLEIGCGTGNTILFLKKKELVKQITGVDINPNRINIAKKRLDIHGLKNCDFIHRDFLKFEPKNSFDFIYSLAAFEAFKPKSKSIEKLIDVASPHCQIVLDMANPWFFKHKAKYINREDIIFMEQFLRKNNFEVKTEFYSFFSSFDLLNLTIKAKQLHKTIRLIGIRD